MDKRELKEHARNMAIGFQMAGEEEIKAIDLDDLDDLIDQLDEPKPELNGKEWLKSRIEDWLHDRWEDGKISSSEVEEIEEFLFDLIYQLDEPKPEVLIAERTVDKEPEKVVIPKFVAEWIEKYQKYEDIYTALSDGFEGMESAEMYNWLHGYEGVGNQELFARAWLDGFTVEKEKKYRVLDKEGYVLLRRYCETVMQVNYKVKPNDYPESERGVLALTEQEIKDYDERYMAFAEEVEE